jgi:plastocyanin
MHALYAPRQRVGARKYAPALFGLLAALSPAPGAIPERPDVTVVKMIDGASYGMRFEPLRVTVQYGDTVRFVQAGGTPHNVEFKSGPAGTELGHQRVGPLLTRRGETYEVVIDRRFAIGKHLYVCTPHETLGMAGLLYVSEPSN